MLAGRATTSIWRVTLLECASTLRARASRPGVDCYGIAEKSHAKFEQHHWAGPRSIDFVVPNASRPLPDGHAHIAKGSLGFHYRVPSDEIHGQARCWRAAHSLITAPDSYIEDNQLLQAPANGSVEAPVRRSEEFAWHVLQLGSRTPPDQLPHLLQRLAKLLCDEGTTQPSSLVQHRALAVLTELIQAQLHALHPNEVARCLWAWASLGYPSPGLRASLELLWNHRQQLSPRALSATITALSRLPSTTEFDRQDWATVIIHRAAELVGSGDAAPVLVMYARMGGELSPLFKAMASSLEAKPLLRPPELIAVAWAYATARQTAADPAVARLFASLEPSAHAGLPVFNTAQVVTLAWAMARVGHCSVALRSALAKVLAQSAANLSPLGLGLAAWSFGTLGHREKDLMAVLAEHSLRHLRAPTAATVRPPPPSPTSRQILTPNPLLPWPAHPIQPAPSRSTWPDMPSLDPVSAWQERLNATSSPRRPGTFGDSIPSVCAASSPGSAPVFPPAGLSSIAWVMAVSGQKDPDLMHALAGDALANLADYTPRQLANLACAFARLGMRHTALIRGAVGELRRRGQEFGRRDITLLTWAAARLAHVEPELLAAAAGAVVGAADRMTPQELANTAWAFAKLAHRHHAALRAIARGCVRQANTFNAQDVATAAWAYATLGQHEPALMDVLAARAVCLASRFRPRELANLAWAYAKLSHYSAPLLEALAALAVGQVEALLPQELSNLAWAYAMLQHDSPALMRALAAAALAKLGQFTPQGLCTVLWALSAAGHESPELWAAAMAGLASDRLAVRDHCQLFQVYLLHELEAGRLPAGVPAAATVGTAESSTDDGHTTIETLACASAASAAGRKHPGAPPIAAAAVVASAAWSDPSNPHPAIDALGKGTNSSVKQGTTKFAPMPDALLAACRRSWSHQTRSGVVSHMQVELHEAAGQLRGWSSPPLLESVVPGSGGALVADVVAQAGAQVVVLEADGPWHFARNTTMRHTGSSVLRNRLLRATGACLLPVHHAKWAQIAGPQPRQAWLRNALADLGVHLQCQETDG